MQMEAKTSLSFQEREYNLHAAIISLIGSDQFFDQLAVLLGEALPFKWLHIFHYSKDAAPVDLGNYPRRIAYKRGFENYLKFTYVINPTYRAFQQGTNSGVYLISDFIPDNYDAIIGSADFEIRIDDSEPIGYRTPGWPKNMTEFIVLLNLPDGTAVDFTFLTETDGSSHKCHDAKLHNVFPILDAVLNKQFEINPNCFEHHSLPGQEEKFLDFGSETLTNREREVVRLILIGHNSNSIALNLCVSLSTIKSHRRNIYCKLQISSQAELFSLFLLHLN